MVTGSKQSIKKNHRLSHAKQDKVTLQKRHKDIMVKENKVGLVNQSIQRVQQTNLLLSGFTGNFVNTQD